jgi:hypothetical protein
MAEPHRRAIRLRSTRRELVAGNYHPEETEMPQCLNASATRRCRLRRGAARRGMRLFNFTCDRAAVKLLVDERETSRAHNVAKDNMPAVLSRFQCSFATAPTNRCWWMMLYANM